MADVVVREEEETKFVGISARVKTVVVIHLDVVAVVDVVLVVDVCEDFF